MGNKDDLTLRLYLLKHNKRHVISYHLRQQILETIAIAETIIDQQIKGRIVNGPVIRRTRKFTTKGIERSSLDSRRLEEISGVFRGLRRYVKTLGIEDNTGSVECSAGTSIDSESPFLYEEYFEVGLAIKVKWVQKDLGTGWKPGWYSAVVQSCDIQNDTINIIYNLEPNVIYSVEVSPCISSGRIKLAAK